MKIISKKITFLMSLIIIIMLIIVFVRQKHMKQQYCNISEDIVGMNDYLEYREWRISVTNATIWSDDSYYRHLGSAYEKYRDAIINESIDSEIIELTIHIERNSKNEDYNDTYDSGIYDFSLLCGSTVIGYDPMLAQALNAGSGSFSDMKQGESCDYIVPYFAYKDGFTSSQWSNRAKLKYELILSVYPEKQVINLDNLQDYIDYDNSVYSEDITTTEIVVESEDEYNDNRIYDINNISQIYSGEKSVNVGGIEFMINKSRRITELEELSDLPDIGKYTQTYDYYINQTDSDIKALDICYIEYSVSMTNVTSNTLVLNIMDTCITDSTSYYNQYCGEKLYTSEYNNTTNDEHKIYFITLQPGENIVCTMVDTMNKNCDIDNLYYKIFFAKYNAETDGTVDDMFGCYIKLNFGGVE